MKGDEYRAEHNVRPKRGTSLEHVCFLELGGSCTMKISNLLKIGKLTLVIVLFFITSLNGKTLAASDQNLLDTSKIDDYINHELENLNIPGASIAIIKGDEVQYIKGYGKAGPSGKEMTEQTPVVLGSVSKSMTALAIMQLVDQGRIQLDNPVKEYIPWFQLADEDAAKEITIRQLLNHTSGISEYDGQWAISDGNQSLKSLVESLKGLHLKERVGETYQYSNLNYSILGAVIEEVTNTSYADYVTSNIFKPLEMNNSYADPKDDKNETTAIGYQTLFGLKVPTEQLAHEANVPHGYLISSAEDMANYMIALLNHGEFKGESILSRQSIKDMQQPSSHMGNELYYGMGWEVFPDMITHNGWTENTYTRVILGEEYGITFLVNSFDYFNSNRYDQLVTDLYQFVQHQEPLKLSEGHPFTIYLIFDFIIALAIAYITFSMYKIFKQPKRKATPFRLFVQIVNLLVLHFFIPFLLLFYLTKIVPLSAAALFLPGIGHASFIILLLLITIGVIQLLQLVRQKANSDVSL